MSLRGALLASRAMKQSIWIATPGDAGLAMTGKLHQHRLRPEENGATDVLLSSRMIKHR